MDPATFIKLGLAKLHEFGLPLVSVNKFGWLKTLNTGVVEARSWTDKGIPPDVAELAADYHIVELILGSREGGTAQRIASKIGIEVYEVYTVKTEANARIARARTGVCSNAN